MNIELEYPNLDQFAKTEVEELSKTVKDLKLQKLKYKLMWLLRSLDDEMVGEGGKIVIGIDGVRLVTGFSQEMIKRIAHLYSEGRKNPEFADIGAIIIH